MKKPTGTKTTQAITTRLAPSVTEYLEQIAQDRGQNRSDVIRSAIAQYLQMQKAPHLT
ncbi:MAG: ribbon-helix-helix domain-containing protein [Hassallia sp. WJT32-NPBG1]|jgi:predicted transcriptional regulator|nr:ribbon-helix-helix domain-containing protein [Hassallia sp. WJT32-NPBG1]